MTHESVEKDVYWELSKFQDPQNPIKSLKNKNKFDLKMGDIHLVHIF